jgi:hypothetical protein
MTLSRSSLDREYQRFIETDNGTVAVRTVNSSSSDISLYDTTSNTIIYLGSAPRGSLTSEAVWILTKIDLSTPVISIKKSATNQVWDNRESVTYE